VIASTSRARRLRDGDGHVPTGTRSTTGSDLRPGQSSPKGRTTRRYRRIDALLLAQQEPRREYEREIEAAALSLAPVLTAGRKGCWCSPPRRYRDYSGLT